MAYQPPYNLEAERSVLGAILLSERSLYALIIDEQLTPSDFYVARHRYAYEAMLRLYGRDEPIDPLTVAEELRRNGDLDSAGGPEAIDELTGSVPLVGNARRYAQIVRDHAQRRRVLDALTWGQQQAIEGATDGDQLINEISARLLDLRRGEGREHMRQLSEIVYDVSERAAQLAGRPEDEAFIGLKTGLIDLDRVLNGLRAGALYVIGGRPSSGKTALGLQWAFNLGEQGAIGLIASLEMQDTEIGERRVANIAKIDLNKVTQPVRLSQADVTKMVDAAAREGRQGAQIWVLDKPTISLVELRAEALELRRRKGRLDFIIVDYLQLLTPAQGTRPGESRVNVVGQFSRGLKQMARELSVPVVALSQLSRASEQRQDKRPTMADLRESGDIEQDANVVLLVHREDYYDPEERPGEVDLIVAKNRQGNRDVDVTLTFQGAFQRMGNYARG